MGGILVEEAVGAFRRATELDPQFAMAYYQLAGTLSLIDLPPARQAIAIQQITSFLTAEKCAGRL
jgi:hypothetical protein